MFEYEYLSLKLANRVAANSLGDDQLLKSLSDPLRVQIVSLLTEEIHSGQENHTLRIQKTMNEANVQHPRSNEIPLLKQKKFLFLWIGTFFQDINNRLSKHKEDCPSPRPGEPGEESFLKQKNCLEK